MSQRRNQQGNQKTETEWKYNIPKFMAGRENRDYMEIYTYKHLYKKEEKPQVNNLCLYTNKLER